MTGRERRQPRARAHRLPLPITHSRTRCRRLPPPPAGFLPSFSRSGLQRRRPARAAPTHPPFPVRARCLQSARPSASPQPPLPPTPLQLLTTPLPALAAPAPGARPAFGQPRAPRPRARANQRPRLRPCPVAPRPPLLPLSVPASQPAARGRGSGAVDPSCHPARLPPPPQGCPGRPGRTLPPL